MIRSTLALTLGVLLVSMPMAQAQNMFEEGLKSVASGESTADDVIPYGEGEGEMPPAGFFAGVYEMVGRDDYRKLVDQRVKIEPRDDGALQVSSCDAQLSFTLTYEAGHEGLGAFVTGPENPIDMMYCPFYTDGGNYPIFTCQGAEYTRITLFPSPDYALEGCQPL